MSIKNKSVIRIGIYQASIVGSILENIFARREDFVIAWKSEKYPDTQLREKPVEILIAGYTPGAEFKSFKKTKMARDFTYPRIVVILTAEVHPEQLAYFRERGVDACLYAPAHPRKVGSFLEDMYRIAAGKPAGEELPLSQEAPPHVREQLQYSAA